jgi:hypothetical protein
MAMTELDADARKRGSAALSALQDALENAEFRVRRFTQELAETQGHLGRAQLEASELRQALLTLQGGDSHEG